MVAGTGTGPPGRPEPPTHLQLRPRRRRLLVLRAQHRLPVLALQPLQGLFLRRRPLLGRLQPRRGRQRERGERVERASRGRVEGERPPGPAAATGAATAPAPGVPSRRSLRRRWGGGRTPQACAPDDDAYNAHPVGARGRVRENDELVSQVSAREGGRAHYPPRSTQTNAIVTHLFSRDRRLRQVLKHHRLVTPHHTQYRARG